MNSLSEGVEDGAGAGTVASIAVTPEARLSTVWREAADAVNDHLALLDGEGRIVAVNAAWCRFSVLNGGTADGCLGGNYLEVCDQSKGGFGDEAATVAAGIRDLLAGRCEEFTLAYPCHSAQERRWFLLRGRPIRGQGAARVIIRHENISSHEATGAESNRVLQMIARNEPLNAIFRAAAAQVEWQHAGVRCEIVLRCGDRQETVSADDFPTVLFQEGRTNRIAAGAGRFTSDLVNLAQTGGPSCMSKCAARPGECGAGKLPEVFQSCSIASLALDHAAALEKLAYEAQHDAVTGLPNRFIFQERLQSAMEGAETGGHGFGVIVLDLDHFKTVNESIGHVGGDGILREAARRLLGLMQPADLLARLGGDEFVILTGSGCPAAVATLAEEIVTAFRTPFRSEHSEFSITCSVGSSIFPADASDPAGLVRAAEEALHEVKKTGRNDWKRFDFAVGAAALARQDIERYLRETLKEGTGLHLVYQPQTDSRDSIVGVEALVRWDHPILGRVSPAQFIPIAEEGGLIVKLGNWVLREACRQAVQWAEEGFDVRMSVNASTVQLCRPDFAYIVGAAIAETGIDPTRLELEITESALMRHLEEGRHEMAKVRRMGVKTSIDDRRFRNRVLVAALPAGPACRCDQDRPDVRARTGWRKP